MWGGGWYLVYALIYKWNCDCRSDCGDKTQSVNLLEFFKHKAEQSHFLNFLYNRSCYPFKLLFYLIR